MLHYAGNEMFLARYLLSLETWDLYLQIIWLWTMWSTRNFISRIFTLEIQIRNRHKSPLLEFLPFRQFRGFCLQLFLALFVSTAWILLAANSWCAFVDWFVMVTSFISRSCLIGLLHYFIPWNSLAPIPSFSFVLRYSWIISCQAWSVRYTTVFYEA